jgi:hypothetical protein
MQTGIRGHHRQRHSHHSTRTARDKPPVCCAMVLVQRLCWTPVARQLATDYDVIMRTLAARPIGGAGDGLQLARDGGRLAVLIRAWGWMSV